MDLASMKNYVYRRTKTDSTSFNATDMLIALNNGYERVNSIIRKYIDNYRPTLWDATALSTGTATPVLDSLFHELIPLWACWQKAVETVSGSVNGFLAEIQMKELELIRFYGCRNYSVFAITIASPGVITKQNHGLVNDQRISFITTGTLPTGISVDTYYYVIYVDEDTFRIASTSGGTAINTSGTQSGTHYYFSDRINRMRVSTESNK